ncbi:hypothetical protein ACLOJK_038476 [Asimina triloba]
MSVYLSSVDVSLSHPRKLSGSFFCKPSQVEAYNAERAFRKIKRHSSLSAVDVDGPDAKMRDLEDQYASKKEVGELSRDDVKRLENEPDRSSSGQNNVLESETSSSQQGDINGRSDKKFIGGPSSWYAFLDYLLFGLDLPSGISL